MITGDQILFHLVGDYVTQSDWMASEKVRRIEVALLHAFVYALPFRLLCSWPAWLVIFGSHAIIDRYRLARYVVWAKNWLGPRSAKLRWVYCTKTGYPPDRPDWMAVWLMIICDNCLHILVNGLAIRYL